MKTEVGASKNSSKTDKTKIKTTQIVTLEMDRGKVLGRGIAKRGRGLQRLEIALTLQVVEGSDVVLAKRFRSCLLPLQHRLLLGSSPSTFLQRFPERCTLLHLHRSGGQSERV